MITVTGATGQVGSALVARLLELGADVRAVVQPGVEVPWSRAEGLQVVVADFGDLAEMRGAARGADAFFLMSPPGEQQVRWQEIQVEAAQDAQVERVVKLSAFDSSSDTSLTMGRWHWAGEQSLRASGLPHAILRPQYSWRTFCTESTSCGPEFCRPSSRPTVRSAWLEQPMWRTWLRRC